MFNNDTSHEFKFTLCSWGPFIVAHELDYDTSFNNTRIQIGDNELILIKIISNLKFIIIDALYNGQPAVVKLARATNGYTKPLNDELDKLLFANKHQPHIVPIIYCYHQTEFHTYIIVMERLDTYQYDDKYIEILTQYIKDMRRVGLYHSNIRYFNIMQDSQGQPKLISFKYNSNRSGSHDLLNLGYNLLGLKYGSEIKALNLTMVHSFMSTPELSTLIATASTMSIINDYNEKSILDHHMDTYKILLLNRIRYKAVVLYLAEQDLDYDNLTVEQRLSLLTYVNGININLAQLLIMLQRDLNFNITPAGYALFNLAST